MTDRKPIVQSSGLLQQIQSGDVLQSDQISTDEVQFDANKANPSYVEGLLFYDRTKKALSYYNDSSEVTVNIGQENLIRVKNTSGSTMPNGAVVYPVGTDGTNIYIGLANAGVKSKCRLVGVLTQTLIDGAIGYVTKFGEVGGLDTTGYVSGEILYLGTTDGTLTNTQPGGSAYITPIAAVKVVNATEGTIVVDINPSEFSAEQSRGTGFSIYDTATLSFTDSSPDRTLTISPVGSVFSFYQQGEKYEKATDSIQIPDEDGIFLVYYDTGTLTYIKNFSYSQYANLIVNYPLVAYIYWDATNKRHIYFGKELHTIGMNSETLEYLHNVLMARWLYGLAPNTITADGTGDLDAHAQFGIDAGRIVDEDLVYDTSSVSSTAGLPIYYISGTTGSPVLRETTNAGFSILTAGTGRMAYNTISAGNWVLSEVASGNYACCHVIAINSNTVNMRVVAVVGQATYTSLALAQSGALTELATLSTYGYIPGQEVKAIATFLFQTNSTYANAVKSRIRSVSSGASYVDFRSVPITGGSGGGGSVSVFSDADFAVYDNVDPTKVLQFQVSGVGAGVTRILTVPDNSGEIVLNSPLTGSGDLVRATSPALETPSADYLTLDNAPVADSDATRKDYVDGKFPVDEDNMTLSDVSTLNASTARHGFLPKLNNVATQYLNGQGNWATPTAASENDYSATAFTGQTSVTVTHNFGAYPIVQVVLSTGAVMIPYTITHNSINDFTVTFASSTTGTILASLGSPQPQSVVSVAVDYTALATDRIINVTASGKTITLYAVSGKTGYEIIVDNSSTGDITVDGNSSETIEGELTQTVPPDSAIRMYCTGSAWRIY